MTLPPLPKPRGDEQPPAPPAMLDNEQLPQQVSHDATMPLCLSSRCTSSPFERGKPSSNSDQRDLSRKDSFEREKSLSPGKPTSMPVLRPGDPLPPEYCSSGWGAGNNNAKESSDVDHDFWPTTPTTELKNGCTPPPASVFSYLVERVNACKPPVSTTTSTTATTTSGPLAPGAAMMRIIASSSTSSPLPFGDAAQIVQEVQEQAREERVRGEVPPSKVYGPAVGCPPNAGGGRLTSRSSAFSSSESEELWQALKSSSKALIGNLGKFIDATLLNVERGSHSSTAATAASSDHSSNDPRGRANSRYHGSLGDSNSATIGGGGSNSSSSRGRSHPRRQTATTAKGPTEGVMMMMRPPVPPPPPPPRLPPGHRVLRSHSFSTCTGGAASLNGRAMSAGSARSHRPVVVRAKSSLGGSSCRLDAPEAPRNAVIKLPPPPSPWQLQVEADAAIYRRHCATPWWDEHEVECRPLKLNENLWRSIFFSLSGEARKAALLKLKWDTYKGGPVSRQTVHGKDARLCCDGAIVTWRYAWSSHLEITVWSIENCPVIGQIVVETDSYRHSFPFKARFIRVPITAEPTQTITLWFNSSYSKPYRQRKLQMYQNSDETGDEEDPEDDWLIRDSLEQDFETAAEVAAANQKLLERCKHSEQGGEYLPTLDHWTTFYRLDLPVAELCAKDGFDGPCLIAPQGDLYRNAGAGTTLDIFEALHSLARCRPEDPRIKLTVKPRIRGRQSLPYSGDCTPAHLLSDASVLSGEVLMDLSCAGACGGSSVIPDASQLAPGCGYKLPPGMSRKLSERDVYVGQIGDPVDTLVSIELNRLGGYLLHRSKQEIQRITQGMYLIGGREVCLERTVQDLKRGPFSSSDLMIESLEDPLFLPNAYNNTEGDFDNYAMTEEGRFVLTLIVHFDGVKQLFFDFMLQRARNMQFASVPEAVAATPSDDDTELYERQNEDTILPSFDISVDQLPWGVQQNAQQLSALSLHADAVRLNIMRMQGKRVPPINDSIWHHLEPPMLTLDEQGSPVPATFTWTDEGEPMLVPIEEFGGELPEFLHRAAIRRSAQAMP